MKKTLTIYLSRIREKLWFRPLLFCIVSVVCALLAHQADGTKLDSVVPSIKVESIEGLLDTIAASMLVISIFAVGSMLAAFSAASTTATPRSFKIVVTDDVSQNALSVFIGAFIFSIVATVALNNGYFGKAGRFILFLFTILFFAVVILTFLRWVDRISRLGRLEHTIALVEAAAARSLSTYIEHPFLQAVPIKNPYTDGTLIYSERVGYVQHINLEAIQLLAEEKELKIQLNCLPGNFVHKNFAIATLRASQTLKLEEISQKMNEAFHIGDTRIFDEDPRFGLIALTEIASRALSPGINDPGTAIQIIGSHERLFFLWNGTEEKNSGDTPLYDRIEVPVITIKDFIDDAFKPIARDAANNIEVMLRLQKALHSIGTINFEDIKAASVKLSKEAFERAEMAMDYKNDISTLKMKSLFFKVEK